MSSVQSHRPPFRGRGGFRGGYKSRDQPRRTFETRDVQARERSQFPSEQQSKDDQVSPNAKTDESHETLSVFESIFDITTSQLATLNAMFEDYFRLRYPLCFGDSLVQGQDEVVVLKQSSTENGDFNGELVRMRNSPVHIAQRANEDHRFYIHRKNDHESVFCGYSSNGLSLVTGAPASKTFKIAADTYKPKPPPTAEVQVLVDQSFISTQPTASIVSEQPRATLPAPPTPKAVERTREPARVTLPTPPKAVATEQTREPVANIKTSAETVQPRPVRVEQSRPVKVTSEKTRNPTPADAPFGTRQLLALVEARDHKMHELMVAKGLNDYRFTSGDFEGGTFGHMAAAAFKPSDFDGFLFYYAKEDDFLKVKDKMGRTLHDLFAESQIAYQKRQEAKRGKKLGGKTLLNLLQSASTSSQTPSSALAPLKSEPTRLTSPPLGLGTPLSGASKPDGDTTEQILRFFTDDVRCELKPRADYSDFATSKLA